MSRCPAFRKGPTFVDIAEFLKKYQSCSKASLELEPQCTLAGRITSIRESGNNLWFVDLVQDRCKAQLVLNRKFCEFNNIRRGDIIHVEGLPTRTNAGELSLKATCVVTVTPCQTHLPDGPLDRENRMRHRHLDMLTNPEFIAILKLRSRIISSMRRFLDDAGFTEVETPVLSTRYGGANARPFETTHSSDLPLYMRIAPELSLKQLVVGGLDRVYELGKVFRNEGIDSTHNPEFTSCEFYQAYSNCDDMMSFVERMLQYIGENNMIGANPFTTTFQRIEIVPTLKDKLRADILVEDEARKLVPGDLPLSKVYDKLISTHLEPLCTQPTFLTGHPMAISPLSKPRSDNQLIADRFELFIDRAELSNGFSEQNDPEQQLRAFQQQAIQKSKGDRDAQPLDEDFVQVLRAGLPPTAGCGIGIDRLVMLLAGKSHIRDVLAFPLLRPAPK